MGACSNFKDREGLVSAINGDLTIKKKVGTLEETDELTAEKKDHDANELGPR